MRLQLYLASASGQPNPSPPRSPSAATLPQELSSVMGRAADGAAAGGGCAGRRRSVAGAVLEDRAVASAAGCRRCDYSRRQVPVTAAFCWRASAATAAGQVYSSCL